jgi:hemerythrin-like domain-containing protein
MLTETYTLVALSVEQTNLRAGLQSLQKLLETNFSQRTALTATQVEYACDALKNLYQGCHWRKLDKFLVPAVRRATRCADQLLLELDRLTHDAAQSMAAALGCAGEAPALDSERRVARFCVAVDNFCTALLTRLGREEQELFSVAREVISGEAWFAIANQMLAHDAYQLESRPDQTAWRVRRSALNTRSERGQRQAAPMSLAH